MEYIYIVCVTHTAVMCAYVYFIHVYLHRQTDKQSGNQTASQTGGAPPPSLVRRHCWLSVPTVSHVMNNCNLYFILLVYYSLSMARFTWLGLAARGVLKVSGEGEAHVRFAAISWRFSVCVCSHTCQATLSSQSNLSSYLPASLLALAGYSIDSPALADELRRPQWLLIAKCVCRLCVCLCVRRLDCLRTCLIHHFCTARQRGK